MLILPFPEFDNTPECRIGNDSITHFLAFTLNF